jgi:hypothetical protein
MRIFDKAKLKPDCANCDAICCVALKLPYAHYPKPAGETCKNLDCATKRCMIFDQLETSGYGHCRKFDCYGAGPVVAELFRGMGENWLSDRKVANVQFNVFAIVYFTLLKYMRPEFKIDLGMPDAELEKFKPFTEAALQLLAEKADAFQK